MYALPENRKSIAEQPPENIAEVGGIYFRSILLEARGLVVAQHVHEHDHATLVCSGRVRLWVNEVWRADYEAGNAVEIKAGERHVFQALQPGTRLCCVHNVVSALSVKRKGV